MAHQLSNPCLFALWCEISLANIMYQRGDVKSELSLFCYNNASIHLSLDFFFSWIETLNLKIRINKRLFFFSLLLLFTEI